MEGGVINLKKEKNTVRTFIRFCPSKKKFFGQDSKECQWVFNTGDHGKSVIASRKSSISKTRCCTVTNEIFKEDVCNSEIYRKTMLQQHAVNVLDGISTNIIVCGPHKTGKTNLLIGSQRSIGIVLQSIYDIFAAIRCYTSGIHINEKGVNTETSGNFDRLFVVKASVLEIGESSSNYKLDNVRDLINPENPLQLIKKLGGELGYSIKGEPEHLFENEEKLVASILSAVARKKVLDAIRRERVNERKKKKTPEQIQNTLFGDFGERWIKDDTIGSLVITVSVESVDRSELENNIRKNEKLANSTHVNCGSLRFFEISSCISTSPKVKTLIPLFGLLDLAFEIRKYCYTNEKSNRINITNISSYVASTIIDSNLTVIGTLSRSPSEKKCCIRPLIAPYDNQTTVQPHSIFDTLQFLEYIGNSMKFPIYPQRSCFKKPFVQSKLMEICRKNLMESKQVNNKMIIKSERGIWQSESSGRVTRIIRLLTFINRSIEGSGILRILMSGNEDDIIRIYCENIVGSGVIDLDGYQINNSTGKWFQIDNYKLPEKEREQRKKLEYINQTEQRYGIKDKNIKNEALLNGKKVKFNCEKKEGKNEIEDGTGKIKNLDFTTEKHKFNDAYYKEISENKTPNQFRNNIKFDDVLLSSNINEKMESSESEIDITDIFDSTAFEHNHDKLENEDFNVNLCEKFDKSSNSKKKILISENVGNSNNYLNVDECIGESNTFNNQISEGIGPDSDQFDPVKQYEKLLKKTISLNKLQKSIMESQKKLLRDESLDVDGNTNSISDYMVKLEEKKPSRYYPLVNKKAIEASQKAIEASKKAIEASKHLYEREVNHSRGKIHDHIPASRNFPQIDIYAPSYDSDIEYDKFHNPKDIVFDFKSSNESDEDDGEKVLEGHYKSNFSQKNESCPCCDQLSKRSKCRCHYADASVNFNGISETSVNTDKSLFLYYEPGAGRNEIIKANGRSWDIFLNIPKKFTDINALGFKHGKIFQNDEQDFENNFEKDENFGIPDSHKISSYEAFSREDISNITSEFDRSSFQTEILPDLSQKSAIANNKLHNKKINCKSNPTIESENKRIKNNILDDLMEIKRQTSNLKRQFILDPKLFRPLYESNVPIKYNNPLKKTDIDEDLRNIEQQSCFEHSLNVSRASSIDNSNDLNLNSNLNNSDYPNFSSENSSPENSFENLSLCNSQINQSYITGSSNNYSDDKYLEEIEMDLNEQLNHFSTSINTHLPNKKLGESDTERSIEIKNYQKTPIENVIREVGCCHIKYILPFPKNLKPKIFKGTNNFQFPYLRSLY
ncbi:TRAFAC type P-loop GTpase that may be related to kinesin [Cryptosporidium sp. chipmunk genotype I]|uniref:TRAFAC type P-loop GTpase that may be related to kinesin n=1 Tax=Cryptosporidium sp. chipmunk genotype I TaxID=1280935 RepID=UPI00351A3B14|nr:TRAFAC type P-loop GTpase that may be related to kinesin [Cryptosporidium sp. chipmunk genotype I]